MAADAILAGAARSTTIRERPDEAEAIGGDEVGLAVVPAARRLGCGLRRREDGVRQLDDDPVGVGDHIGRRRDGRREIERQLGLVGTAGERGAGDVDWRDVDRLACGMRGAPADEPGRRGRRREDRQRGKCRQVQARSGLAIHPCPAAPRRPQGYRQPKGTGLRPRG
jgi:hypothetical protein